jgi:PEP-CTERM motif
MSLELRKPRRTLRLLWTVVFGVLLFPHSASATSIAAGTWFEFAFGSAGSFATGCDPADPAGPFCLPSGGTPTTFAGAPPWTFTSGASGSTLTVTDAFVSGDRFTVQDFGVSVGSTSAFAAGISCGDDPVPCLANPGMSHGTFVFAPGAHSIQLLAAQSGGGGAGYFRLVDGGAQAVPEPATVFLVATGAGAALWRRRRA